MHFHNIGFLHQNENELDKSFGNDKIVEKKAYFSLGINVCHFVFEDVFWPIFIKTYNDTLIQY